MIHQALFAFRYLHASSLISHNIDTPMRVRFWFNLNCSLSFEIRAFIGEPSRGTEKSPAHSFLSLFFLQSSGFVSIQFALFPYLLPSPFNSINIIRT